MKTFRIAIVALIVAALVVSAATAQEIRIDLPAELLSNFQMPLMFLLQ